MEPMKKPCVVSIVVPAPPSEVYNRISDVSQWDTWMTKQKPSVKCEKSGSLKVDDRFKWNAGVPINSWITEAKPGVNFTWKGKALGGLLKAHHRWEFEETPLEGHDGVATKVTISETMSGMLAFTMTHSMLSDVNLKWGESLKQSFSR